jgi:hypothetical protein
MILLVSVAFPAQYDKAAYFGAEESNSMASSIVQQMKSRSMSSSNSSLTSLAASVSAWIHAGEIRASFFTVRRSGVFARALSLASSNQAFCISFWHRNLSCQE